MLARCSDRSPPPLTPSQPHQQGHTNTSQALLLHTSRGLPWSKAFGHVSRAGVGGLRRELGSRDCGGTSGHVLLASKGPKSLAPCIPQGRWHHILCAGRDTVGRAVGYIQASLEGRPAGFPMPALSSANSGNPVESSNNCWKVLWLDSHDWEASGRAEDALLSPLSTGVERSSEVWCTCP